jgi:hypothetical protein
MNILNLFKKKEYPAIVKEIHNEFETSSDRLLLDKNNSISLVDSSELDKLKRLKNLGFKNVQQVKEVEKKIIDSDSAKREIELIEYYKVYYPNNKFVANGQIQSICKKYGLVYGGVSQFKGFVPEDKLRQIEKFKLRKEEENIFVCSGVSATGSVGLGLGNLNFVIKNAKIVKVRDFYHLFKKEEKECEKREKYAFQSEDGVSFYARDKDNIFGLSHLGWISFTIENRELKICAPLKDMDMTGKVMIEGYKSVNIPDPVVIQPVEGGGLILAMWADETFDPFGESELINEVNN